MYIIEARDDEHDPWVVVSQRASYESALFDAEHIYGPRHYAVRIRRVETTSTIIGQWADWGHRIP